ncbi:unnamed protein product, partial [Rotaria socialis]
NDELIVIIKDSNNLISSSITKEITVNGDNNDGDDEECFR